MLAIIDLNQFAVALPPNPRLMEGLTLFTRGQEASLQHPRPQRLAPRGDAVPLVKRFDGQRRSKVPVLSSDQLKCVLSETLVRAAAGSSAKGPCGSARRHHHPGSAATAGLPAARSCPRQKPLPPRCACLTAPRSELPPVGPNARCRSAA